MFSGIYIIHNAKTGGIYVGQSQDIKGRWKQHTHDLKKGKHPNKVLQAAWDKCGAKHFSFKVLEYCAVDQLNDRERHFINIYLRNSECYNSPNAAPTFFRRSSNPPENPELNDISLVNNYRLARSSDTDPLQTQNQHALMQLRTLIANGGAKADIQKYFQRIQENAPKLPKFEDGYLVLAIATQLMHDMSKSQETLPLKDAA